MSNEKFDMLTWGSVILGSTLTLEGSLERHVSSLLHPVSLVAGVLRVSTQVSLPGWKTELLESAIRMKCASWTSKKLWKKLFLRHALCLRKAGFAGLCSWEGFAETGLAVIGKCCNWLLPSVHRAWSVYFLLKGRFPKHDWHRKRHKEDQAFC